MVLNIAGVGADWPNSWFNGFMGREIQLFDRITWNPSQMNGQPCIRGMRLTVRRVLELLSQYNDRSELFLDYPDLEPEDLRQALSYAAANLEDEAVPNLVA